MAPHLFEDNCERISWSETELQFPPQHIDSRNGSEELTTRGVGLSGGEYFPPLGHQGGSTISAPLRAAFESVVFLQADENYC